MPENACYRLQNTTMVSVCAVEAPIVVTSAQFDEQLTDIFARTTLRAGTLEKLAGVTERRWWPEDVTFADASAMAGAKAMAEAGITADQVGLLINTSVSRAYLEPSTAVAIHDQLGLPARALNFDIVNACLGFMTAIQLAGTMIDSGQIEYALIVAGEDTRLTQQRTLDRLSRPEATAVEFRNQFATLTLGSGAAAMVLGRASDRTEGHRVVGGVSRAGTEHHQLCVGDLEHMHTDTKGLFDNGLALAVQTWRDAAPEFDWSRADRFVAHQTSVVHIRAMAEALGVEPSMFPMTLPTFGNMGPVAVPFTLAREADRLSSGDQVVLLGIGSGLNTSFVELTW